MNLIKLYALTAIVFFAVDFVWLTRVANGFYRAQLGPLLRDQPVIWAAVAFYLLFLVGILVFAVLPGLEAASLARTAALGGLLGLVAYATFDLTCLALFSGFPVVVVIVDLVWGTLLASGVSVAGFAIGRWLGMP